MAASWGQAELGAAPGEPLYEAVGGPARRRPWPWRALGLAAAGTSAALVAAAAVVGSSGHSFLRFEHGAATDLSAVTCSRGTDSCLSSKCCAEPGQQCYQQDANFAMCRPSCTPGPDPTFSDGTPWTCATLGERSAGEYACGKPGQDCRSSQCCADSGMQCYQKNESFATCKAECVAGGPDLTDIDGTPWTCKELGARTPGKQAWVDEVCASGWQSCTEKRCCKVEGEQCYLQSAYFGECKALNACSDPGWSCKTSGSRTPTQPAKGGILSPWTQSQCNQENEGCLDSKCCLGMELQCYAKNDGWAQCMQSCAPGPHAEDHNETWSCTPLGPRAYGLAVKGSPSLFCFTVLRVQGYEAGLLGFHKSKDAGIFACDDYMLLTADGTTTVGGVKTVQFPGAPIVQSIDNTAGNTELFVNAWKKVIEHGKWKQHAFTVKVDPDAVFFPERLRWHVASYLGQKIFVINCHMGDMIYGALEVYSFAAIQEWAWHGKTCNAPNNYGEDKYMTQCMDHLGVARVHDESVLGDKLCHTFAGCSNGWNSAFHPFKDVGSWQACWNEANAATA